MDKDSVSQVELKINDKEIDINPFVHQVIENVTLGLVTSLRLEEEVRKIELKITDL